MWKCEKEHYKHKNKIILYKKEKLNEKKKKEKKNELKDNILKINQYKEQINTLNHLFNEFCNNLNNELDNYIKLYNIIIILLSNLNNYENIKNILNLNYQNMNTDINNFLNENFKNKMKYLINKFSYKREYTLIYYINTNENKVKLFDNRFVKNKKDNYYLIIENKKINLCEYYNVNNIFIR